MLIVQPSVEVLAWSQLPGWREKDKCSDLARITEMAGRTSWKSEDKQGPGTADGFCVRVVNIKKDYSIAEHASVTMRFVTDRFVSHQLVRHRIAAYTQESTHYINYGKEKYEGHIQVCEPMGVRKYKDFGEDFPTGPLPELPQYEADPNFTEEYKLWYFACLQSERAYFGMLNCGVKHYHARYALPACLKTELVATYNLRMWQWVLEMRTTPANTPEVAHVAKMAGREMAELCPEMFSQWK